MTESGTPSEDEIKRQIKVMNLWMAVQKKLERTPKLKKDFETATDAFLKEHLCEKSRNEMTSESRQITDNISKFIEKYAPLGDIIKAVDDRHHRGQLGYGAFTLLWLMIGAATSDALYIEGQLELMMNSLHDIPKYESLWYGETDDGELLARIYDVYEAFALFVAYGYKYYSSNRAGRIMRSILLPRNIVEGKVRVFNDAVRRVLEHSRYLHERHVLDRELRDLLVRRDRIVSQITKLVEPHGACEGSNPEKFLRLIQQDEDPSDEDDLYAPETGSVLTLDRAKKFKSWRTSPECAMLLLKAQNYIGTGPNEPLWISSAIAKYTCDVNTATNHSRVIFRAVHPDEDISAFLASIVTSILRWNQGFFKDHAQHNSELLELLDIIYDRRHGTQDKTKALLGPMKSLLRTWLQEFSGSTITIIACDFHNYAENWSDKNKRPPTTLVDFIDALLQVMGQIANTKSRLKVCLVVKSHAWPETLEDKIRGQCGRAIELESVLHVDELAQTQRGIGG